MNKETEQQVIPIKKEYDFEGEIEHIKEIVKSFESFNLNDDQMNHLLRSTFLYVYIVMEETIKHYINNFHDNKKYTFFDLNEDFQKRVIKEKAASINNINELLNNGIFLNDDVSNVLAFEKFIFKNDIKISALKDLQKHFNLMGIEKIYLDDEQHIQKNICEYIDDLNRTRRKFAHELKYEYSKEKLEEDILLIEKICNKISNAVCEKMP